MTQVNKSTKATGGKSRITFNEYGYTPDGDGVPQAYLVRITSLRSMSSVVAILQDDIQMRVESRWDPFIPISVLAKGNILAQAVSSTLGSTGPKSLVTKAASRRIWVGTTPMTFSLKLKFEAINDSFLDVVEPCRILQSLALPSEPTTETPSIDKLKKIHSKPAIEGGGVLGVLKELPLLSPPGPSPFSWEGILTSRKPIDASNIAGIIEGSKGGDRIILQLGQFLKFDDVIVKEVSTAYHIKMDIFGDPISADVNIVFETYEIPTVGTLKKAYEKSSLFNDYTKRPADQNLRKEFHITTFG